MKLYTKKGDKGQTSLLGGRRVSKSIVRLEVIGCLDELNAQLGLVSSKINKKDLPESQLADQIERIQRELFELGADIATTYSTSTSLQKSISRIPTSHITKLEKEIDHTDKQLKPLKNFILPGGHEIAAQLQVARGIARRAERNLVRLQKGAKINKNTLQYLNRLSDWLFTQARLVNTLTETPESNWQ